MGGVDEYCEVETGWVPALDLSDGGDWASIEAEAWPWEGEGVRNGLPRSKPRAKRRTYEELQTTIHRRPVLTPESKPAIRGSVHAEHLPEILNPETGRDGLIARCPDPEIRRRREHVAEMRQMLFHLKCKANASEFYWEIKAVEIKLDELQAEIRRDWYQWLGRHAVQSGPIAHL